jgi:hypothetical protein
MKGKALIESHIFQGDERYGAAEEELSDLKHLVGDDAGSATDRIVELCRQAATRNGLTDDEYAYLLTWHLLVWRENRHHEDLSSGYAINLASFALACIPEDDDLHWICENANELITGAQGWLDSNDKATVRAA